MREFILKNPFVKNILSAAAVAVFGFILLNLTFIFDFLFQSAMNRVIRIFISINPEMNGPRFPSMMHVLFLVLIIFISWFVFKSKLGVLYKAIYMTVPVAVVFVTLGIFLSRWPAAVYSIGTLIGLGGLYYFYRTKQPWLYYFALILVILTLMIISLKGIDI